jgi:hypothetical protein
VSIGGYPVGRFAVHFALRFALPFALRFAVHFTLSSARTAGFPLGGAGLRGSAFFEISIRTGNLL